MANNMTLPKYFLRCCLLIAAAAVIGSCTAKVPVPVTLSFARYQPIYMDVSKINIIEEYKSSGRAPYVEHLLPYSPDDALQIWIKDRLRTVGLNRELQIIVKDASVVATTLPSSHGVTGFLTLEHNRRYDAKLTVEMRIYNGGAMSEASINVTATRTVTIGEDASAATRQDIFNRMIFDLMETFNAETEKNMYQYLGNYINYSHNP